MANVAAAVTVVTTADEHGAHATTVSAFTSLSLDPPMVMFALDRSSELLARLEEVGRCGVNILNAGQSNVAMACAKRGPDKLANIKWELHDGLPRITGALGWLRCDIEHLYPGGDHHIVCAHVRDVELAGDDGAPCIYFRRNFATLQGAT